MHCAVAGAPGERAIGRVADPRGARRTGTRGPSSPGPPGRPPGPAAGIDHVVLERGEASLCAGVPTRWSVESLEGRSCTIFLQVPPLGLAVTLQPGDNVIDLPPLEPGRIAYTCSMGMYGGTLRVVEAPTGALEGTRG